MIDDFEGSNPFASYLEPEEHAGTPAVTSEHAWQGERALHLVAASGSDRNPVLYSKPDHGLNAYPGPGSTFEAWLRTDNVSTGGLSLLFGGSDNQNCYRIHNRVNQSKLEIQVLSGGNNEILAQTSDVQYVTNTWYRARVDWGSDGEITVELFDQEQNILGEVTASSSEYSEPLIGYRRWSGGSRAHAWIDSVALDTS